MKKSIIISCAVLTTFSLTAFGYFNWNTTATDHRELACNTPAPFETDFTNPLFSNASERMKNNNFFYAVDSRFATTITKEDLYTAKSILDILPKEATDWLGDYTNVKVSRLLEDGEKAEIGGSETLTMAQLKLVQSFNYSTDFYITADCKEKNPQTGKLESYDLVYYMTVVPETEAAYTRGPDAIIEYLKENSKAETAMLDPKQLKPGKLSFIITKTGEITDVKLNTTSGYPSVDKTMVKLVEDMPGKWAPATNAKGENVDQKFVFSFGQVGC